jgi:TolA-binding protein
MKKFALLGAVLAIFATGCASAPPPPGDSIKLMETALNTDNASAVAELYSSAFITGACIGIREEIEKFNANQDYKGIKKSDLTLPDRELAVKVIQITMLEMRDNLNRIKLEVTEVKMEDNGSATATVKRKDTSKKDKGPDKEYTLAVQMVLENDAWKLNSSIENTEVENAYENTAPEKTKSTPASPEAEQSALKMLRNADLFRDQHPYDISDQINMYRKVVEKFPGTNAAKEAAARIEEAKKEPGAGDDWTDESNDDWTDESNDDAVPAPPPAPAPAPAPEPDESE